MYERVWSGEVEGCEVSLGFNEEDGLFSYTAKRDGMVLRDRHCADPVDAGLMDGPGSNGMARRRLSPAPRRSNSRTVSSPFTRSRKS